MKAYLPEIILVAAGLAVMGALIYLIAASEGWVRLAGILGLAVLYTGWYRVLLRLARRKLGVDEDDDDQPFFPG